MKRNIGFGEFTDAFLKMGRKDNFSYHGLMAIFEYLEQYEKDCGEEIELDVIAICCEYTEYENLQEIMDVYDQIESLEDLRDYTQVIEFDGGIIIQDF